VSTDTPTKPGTTAPVNQAVGSARTITAAPPDDSLRVLRADLKEQLLIGYPALVRCVAAGWSITPTGNDGTVLCPACWQQVPTVELEQTQPPVICIHGRSADDPTVVVPIGTKVRQIDSWLITYTCQPSIMHLACGKTSLLARPATSGAIQRAQSGHACGPIGSPWDQAHHRPPVSDGVE
jgi:hypothetical protein